VTAVAQVPHFRHEALLYDGIGQFVGSIVPFIRDGLAAQERVLVVVSPAKIEALRAELGSDAEAVSFADMTSLGRNPARLIPAWRRFIDSRPHPEAMRGVGEPIYPDRSPAELVEAQAHETLLNLAFGATPGLKLWCPYDIGVLPPEVVAGARRSHPIVVAHGSAEAHSDTYLHEHPSPARLDQPLSPAPSHAKEFRFGSELGELGIVRGIVWQYAVRAGLNRLGVDSLTVAANEIATNSQLHGGGRGFLRLWTQDGSVICEVSDAGRISGSPLLGRSFPPMEQRSGRGLWLVNQLCDLVQVRSGPGGTVIRLHMRGDHE
jgi:anti-sigma regulatory factor (Ser/Thr protein kinase)